MQNSTMIVLLAGLLVSGCDPWDSLPGQETVYLGGSLWSSDVVAADDGLYVSLDRSGKLVHVALDGTFQEVDLGGATPLELRLANDQHTMLAFLTWLSCEHPDEDISRASECPADDLKDEYSLGVVSGGDLTGEIPLPPDFNQVFFGPADTGRDPVAVVFMDPDADSVIEGVLSRNQVVFINLAEPSEPQYVSVGFQARNVLFTDDGARAVVFSQNQAAVVDVAAAFTVEVTFPFTLDSDVTVDPQSAVFTPDGTHILMAAVGRSDIYDFNLERRSINIIELDGVPTMMGVDPVADKTAVVYSSLPRVDIIEHAQFGVSTTGLDDPCNHVVESDDGFVLLYNDYSSTRDIYRVDAETGAVVEYVVPSPVTSVHLARDNSRAVAMLRPAAGSGGGYGMAVLDLSDDKLEPYGFGSEPVGFAVSDEDEVSYALLLLKDYELLTKVNISDFAQPETVSLPAAPTGLGAMPGGGFYITHDASLGLISFYDPADDSFTLSSGFAAIGIFLDDTLPRTGAEE